jgi:hypothetical protein
MMKPIMQRIQEAKDVSVYKRLIQILGEYSKGFPFTGVDKYFQKAVNMGKNILPRDKTALNIIEYVLQGESSSGVVQKLLNTRFSDLPVEHRPCTKKDRRKEVAFWMLKDRMGDKVVDLINFEGEGTGHWVTADGEKATLIDMQ